jgi:hypothetical protein
MTQKQGHDDNVNGKRKSIITKTQRDSTSIVPKSAIDTSPITGPEQAWH